ncbi:MAG: hypothetical protein A2Y38_00595 [Spirochaetes bacterium GWB1_59_5]|nr:MAG: hypothetical protein A2Y38_00595 [Spirochaetes bacterium GWB1_59_5]
MESYRFSQPLFACDVVFPDLGIRARHLSFERCGTTLAVSLTREWHSRLPNVQAGPWQYAFRMHYQDMTFAVALWNNPSARTLPAHWMELRRMACAPDSPRNTASRFLSLMVGWLKANRPDAERCISYQDTAVHQGTIYKAAGWQIGYVAKARDRDRSKSRAGTNRAYRSDMNGQAPAGAEKIRWELVF